MKRLIPILLLLFLPTVANAELICVVDKAVVCVESGTCKPIYQEGGYFTAIDIFKREYSLCNANKNKCDTFPLETVDEGGIFQIFYTGLGGATLKRAFMNGIGVEKDHFIEVRPSQLGVFVSWGICFSE